MSLFSCNVVQILHYKPVIEERCCADSSGVDYAVWLCRDVVWWGQDAGCHRQPARRHVPGTDPLLSLRPLPSVPDCVRTWRQHGPRWHRAWLPSSHAEAEAEQWCVFQHHLLKRQKSLQRFKIIKTCCFADYSWKIANHFVRFSFILVSF